MLAGCRGLGLRVLATRLASALREPFLHHRKVLVLSQNQGVVKPLPSAPSFQAPNRQQEPHASSPVAVFLAGDRSGDLGLPSQALPPWSGPREPSKVLERL